MMSSEDLPSGGLVAIVGAGQRGPSVVTLSATEAAQVYEAREAVEGMACRIFAVRATPTDLKRLTQALTALEQAIAGNNRAASLAAKTRFYDALMIGAGNPVLHDMARQLRARAAILRLTSMSRAGRIKDSLAAMQAIADALQRREPQATHAACITHLGIARSVAIATLTAHVA